MLTCDGANMVSRSDTGDYAELKWLSNFFSFCEIGMSPLDYASRRIWTSCSLKLLV